VKLGGIGLLKNIKRELRPVGDRSVELGLGFCFQQSVYPRVGYVAGNAGRGLQKSPRSRLIAGIGKDNTSPLIHTDNTDRNWGR
jgi:hypothetical protein